MARVSHIIEGLQILLKHCEPDDHLCGAEHDEIFGPPVEPEKLSESDMKRLDELGWTADDDGYYSHYC